MTTRIYDNKVLLGEVSDLLAEGGLVTLMTKGFSMEPFIRGEMDSVRLRKKPEIKVGDIVLARLKGEVYVLHRVFAIDGDRVTLMGDGNLSGKEHCRLEDVTGTVEAIISPSGKERIPGDGHIWRRLMPVRRIILGIYRRVYRRKYRKEFFKKYEN